MRAKRPPRPTYQSLTSGPQSYVDLAVRAMDAELAAIDAGDGALASAISGDVLLYARKASKDPNVPVAFMAMIQRKHDAVMRAIKRAINDAG